MSKFLEPLGATFLLICITAANLGAADDLAPERAGGYGLGRVALPEEVAAWNTDLRPDGQGLPVGSGDVLTGEAIFTEICAVCHGDFGEGAGRWPVLAGGKGSLENKDPVKTIGSYWPYLSTVFDYVNRAMPFGHAQSLQPDEVYAITAYLLYLNDEVDEDFTLSNENFTSVHLPNETNFFMDDRETSELPIFSAEACMENCKETVKITMHASVLDVTPQEDTSANEPATPKVELAAGTPEPAAVAEPAPAAPAELDPALVAEGESVFKKCKACHQVGEGAVNRVGPELNGIVGRAVGGVEGFKYSKTFADAGTAGKIWTSDELHGFLTNPRKAMPGTKMSFAGLRDSADIDAVLAYIQSVGG